mmetsp:Transcript_19154/g.36673  ORF Transcript_19154/g.36673 Transcript_19154/m.36673 type:complete len:246 (+) Transcript_19154:1148-1885(+)
MLQEAEPYSGHCSGDRHPLALQQRIYAGAVHVWAWEDEGGTSHRCCESDAPRVGVEHGNHCQDGFRRTQVEARSLSSKQGVQHIASVGVHDAFGVSRRAARVAKPARRLLGEDWPLVRSQLSRLCLGQYFFVAQKRWDGAALGHVRAVGEHNHVLERGQARVHLLQHREQIHVHENRLVLSVICDVHQLLCEQPRVEGVAYGSHAHNGVPSLHVPVCVPRHGPHHVAQRYTQGVAEGMRQQLGAV